LGRNRWSVTIGRRRRKVAEFSYRGGRWTISPEPGRRFTDGDLTAINVFMSVL
jgi:hypothetical protein